MTKNEMALAIGYLCSHIDGEGKDRVLIDKLEDKYREGNGSLSYYMTSKLKKLKQKYIYIFGDE